MTEIVHGGLPEAAAKPVDGIPPHERIADWIESDDGGSGPTPEGERGDRSGVDAPDASPRSWGFDVEEINRSYAVAIWGGKTVVVNEQAAGPVNDRVRVMSFESQNAWFANRYTEIKGSDGKVRPVTWAQAWQRHPDRRQYEGIEFFPNPDGAKGTPNYLNFWRGFDVKPSPAGKYDVFRDHLLNNVCDGDPELFKYVFAWMAHIVQRPRERPGTALVLIGRRGTGKSKVGEVLGSLFPAHYYQVDDARYITGQFNEHMASCLLLQAEEAIWAGDKAAEGRLKGLITSEMQMIESKGVNAIRMRNFVRVIMTSNESWVVPAGMDERRFVVLDVNPRCAQNHSYFAEMDEELNNGGRERLLHDLQTFDLSQVNLRHLPQTPALLEQKIRSLDTIDDWWFNRLHEGGDWPERTRCDDLYTEYFKAPGVGRKRGPAEFGKRLLKLASIRKVRPAMEADEPGTMKRVWCYELPSLDECRAAFDDLVGQPVPWPALPPGEGERAQRSSGPDEAIPA
ncbi:primase-helicase family protein [Bradyrhizobium sp. 195]|uniref:primase-helicase family protein n=1 Tax=Bradyrhizobium sp. 195 TaxID=2782662 RepID=UPI002001C75C|nr:primase-helicase family protein [Bradyrhizobium sp. 195]UPK25938.1 virulence-associated E family protein [Bradyrhizobium sp. 195]